MTQKVIFFYLFATFGSFKVVLQKEKEKIGAR
jgi:hypothetical protein